jgi:hypothetical protein
MAKVPARVNGSPREAQASSSRPFRAHRGADAERDGLLGAFARLFGDY